MQIVNKLLVPLSILATGFALGQVTANYFAAENTEGKNAESTLGTALFVSATESNAKNTASPTLLGQPKTPMNAETIEKNGTSVPSAVTVAQPQPTTQCEPPTEVGGLNNLLDEDITLSETIDPTRQETVVTEPSPEELAFNPPAHAITVPVSAYETTELEHQLRLESENAIQFPHNDNVDFLENEVL